MLIEFYQNTPNGVFITIAALMALLTALIMHRKKNFRDAADSFRSKTLTEVQGIIPNNGAWLEPEINTLKTSIPAIKKYALELRPHIPFYKQKAFDRAVVKYCNTVSNTDYQTYVADMFYHNRDKVPQRELISNAFSQMLGFTS
jgi:hypothetical protein